MSARESYVFVSYASADRQRVLEIVGALHAAGIACWIDQHDIAGGANWGGSIAAALEGCAAVVLMSSAASLASRNVRQEIALAWQHDKPCVPLLLELAPVPTDVAYWLATAQWIEVLDRPVAEWLPRVTRALERLSVPIGSRPPDAQVDLDQSTSPAMPAGAVPPITPRPAEFVGRDADLARIRPLLDAAVAGHGHVVMLGGEAGIGKSTLVQALAHEAGERGFRVLVGHCYDLSTTPPYGPWDECYRGWLEIALFDRIEQLQGQTALFEAMLRVSREATARVPILLILEDLHWSDQASLDALRYVASRLDGIRSLVVGTYRTDELHRRHPLYQLLPVLVREAQVMRLELQPLLDNAVADLIDQRYQLPNAERARLAAYVQRHAEGHGLYVSELLHALEEEGILTHVAVGWTLGDLNRARVPRLVREVIEARVARLPDTAQSALAVAAVIGQEVPVEVWGEVADASDNALLDAIDTAVGAHLLTMSEDGTTVQFQHALIREALYESVLPLRRRLWHRQTGELLAASRDPDPDAVAYHYQQAGDPRAYPWLVRAGDRAQRAYDLLGAIERFESAAHVIEHDSERTRDRAWLHYRIGRQWRMYDPARGLGYLEEAEALAARIGDRTLEAFALFDRGNLHGWTAMSFLAVETMRPAVELLAAISRAELERDPIVCVWVADLYLASAARQLPALDGLENALDLRLGVLAFLIGVTGRFAEAQQLARPYVERLATGARSPLLTPSYADACSVLAVAAAHFGKPDEAYDWFQEGIRANEAIGYYDQVAHTRSVELKFVTLPYAPFDLTLRRSIEEQITTYLRRGGREFRRPLILVALYFLEGRWSELDDTLEAIRAEQYLHFTAPGFALLVARGEYDTVERIAPRWLPNGPDTAPGTFSFHVLTVLQLSLIEIALARQDLDSARAWIDAHDRYLDWSDNARDRPRAQLLHAAYHQATGDLAIAREHAEESLRLAAEPHQPLAEMAALRLLGALDTATGQYDDAEQRLTRSLDIATAALAPFERALTLLALAELRLGESRLDDARARLAEVRAICEPLGARPTLERVVALESRITTGGAEGWGLGAE